MLPNSWAPIPVKNLVRIGSSYDGGYVVPANCVARSKLLIGMGLNDDWSFEEDFRARSGAAVLCFDHSVDGGFWRWYFLAHLIKLKPMRARKYFEYRAFFGTPEVEHRKLMIGYDGAGSVSLETILRERGDADIFLKIDIEGAEYRILDQIVAHAHRFTGIVMELHDVDLHRERIGRFLHALPGFILVSLHANNYAPTDPQGDPTVIEISLGRDDLLVRDEAGSSAAQSLETPCNPAQPEVHVRFESRAAA